MPFLFRSAHLFRPCEFGQSFLQFFDNFWSRCSLSEPTIRSQFKTLAVDESVQQSE